MNNKIFRIAYISLLPLLTSCASQLSMEGTLACSGLPNVLCELSSAEVVTIKGKKYLISTNDKDTSLYLWELDRFKQEESQFQRPFKADLIIPLPPEVKIDKIESLASINDWTILGGSYSLHPKDPTKRNNSLNIIAIKFDAFGKVAASQVLATPKLWGELPKLSRNLKEALCLVILNSKPLQLSLI